MSPSEAVAMEINLVCTILFLFAGCVTALPQDIGTGLLLAAGQMKDLIESGVAARQDKSIEVLGQRMHGGMELGFGDAMRRNRRDLGRQLTQGRKGVAAVSADHWSK